VRYATGNTQAGAMAVRREEEQVKFKEGAGEPTLAPQDEGHIHGWQSGQRIRALCWNAGDGSELPI
jgi:hypothetical protein